MINTVTAAYAEKSPLVVISGSPGMKERTEGALLHHKGKDFYTQQRIYDEITVASALLDEPFTAFNEIDRVLYQINPICSARSLCLAMLT